MTAPLTASSSGRVKELSALHGLRFFAAFHVMLFHNTVGFQSHLPAFLRSFIQTGDVAVSLFFVLSGFVLAYTYRDRAATSRGKFWMARFARIYPAYLVGLIVALPIFLSSAAIETGSKHVIATVVSVLTLTQAWFPKLACEWNCPGWSLSTEAFFYLAFPGLALLLWRCGQRGVLLVSLAAWAGSFLFMVAERVAGPVIYPTDGDGVRLMLGANPILRLPEFIVGVALGIWFVRGGRLPRSGLLATLSAALLVAIYCTGRLTGDSLARLQYLLPLFAILILALASGDGVLARGLARPGIVLLGKASYALYLLHASLSPLAKTYIFSPGSGRQAGTGFLGVAVFFTAYFIGAVAISVAVFKWIEEPARRAIRAWDERRRRLKTVVPAVDSPA